MIRIGFPPYEGRGPELNATISTVLSTVGHVIINTPMGTVYIVPLDNATLVLTSGAAYAAVELWETLAGDINTGKMQSDKTGSNWSAMKPDHEDYHAWAAAAIAKWQG